MAKLLYIKANPKSDQDSITFKMSEGFIQAYREAHSGDEIITLDLYKENIKFLDGEMLGQMFGAQEAGFIKYSKQFAEADKFVFAAPLWNLSYPAIVKAYIDYVMVAGITFKYTETGPIGLLADKQKKAVHILASGGAFSQSPVYQTGNQHLKIVLGFMGINNVTTITCENTGVLQGPDLEAAVSKSVENAKQAGKAF